MYLTLASFAATSKKIKRLNKRLEKKGMPLITYTADEKYMAMKDIFPKHNLPKFYGEIMVNVVDFSFTSDFEKFQIETGYEFIAVVDHNENLIHSFVEGVDVERFRTRAVCDHCKTKRNRSKTVILRKGEELFQIGTKCLSDFFQKDVNDFVKAMELFSSNHAMTNDPSDYFYGGSSHAHCMVELKTILKFAVASVHKYGYVPTSEPNSTRQVVSESIFGGNLRVSYTKEDEEEADEEEADAKEERKKDKDKDKDDDDKAKSDTPVIGNDVDDYDGFEYLKAYTITGEDATAVVYAPDDEYALRKNF